MAIAGNLVGVVGLARMPGGRQPFMELPPNNVHIWSAAGRFTFTAGSMAFSYKNTGDAVWMKVQLLSGAANAGADMGSGDGKSIPLATGDSFDFALPDDADPTAYCIDIRAFP